MDVREKLVELLSEYFDIGDSYCYNLTRTKNAFACGTMGFDDFEEFDDETVADIADHLIAHGVTVQEWISVKERLPECSGKYIVCTNRGKVYQTKFYSYMEETGGHWGQKDKGKSITHWMPLPQPPIASFIA